MSTLDRVAAAFNPSLKLEGVLLTMFDDRTILSQQVRANLQEFFADKLFTTVVPRNIRLAEAPSHGKPAVVYDPRSRGAEAYFDLAHELLQRNGHAITMPRPRKKLIVDPIPSTRGGEDDAAYDDEPAKKKRIWPFGK